MIYNKVIVTNDSMLKKGKYEYSKFNTLLYIFQMKEYSSAFSLSPACNCIKGIIASLKFSLSIKAFRP